METNEKTEVVEEAVNTVINKRNELLTKLVIQHAKSELIYAWKSKEYTEEMTDAELLDWVDSTKFIMFAMNWGSIEDTFAICREAFRFEKARRLAEEAEKGEKKNG